MSKLQTLRAQGFDRSEHIPFTRSYRVKCSQCEACCINGVACHESGCPNQVYECKGCWNKVERRNSYCSDCL